MRCCSSSYARYAARRARAVLRGGQGAERLFRTRDGRRFVLFPPFSPPTKLIRGCTDRKFVLGVVTADDLEKCVFPPSFEAQRD